MSNVGFATLQIIPTTKGFQSALNGQIGTPLAATGKTGGEKAGKGFAGGFLPLAAKVAGPLAAAFAGVQAVGFLGDAISSASDLNETISKTTEIFGNEVTPALLDFSNKAATAFGMSKQTSLDAISTFGVFGKAAGLTGKDLGKFATDLTGLSADLASFYNTDAKDAADAIGAALRGEAEPMRRYGVLLNDATLRQKALEMGLITSVKNGLTPQQKALAAQAVILDQTKVAQGDFARTSSGLANQTRSLGENFENLKSTLGQAFLPVATAVVSFLNQMMVPALEWVQKGADWLSQAFSGAGKSGSGFGGIISKVAATVKPFADYLMSLGGIIRDVVLPAVMDAAKTFLQNMKPAFDAIFEVVKTNVLPTLKSLWENLQKAMPTIRNIISIAAQWYGAFYKVYTGILGQLIAALVRLVGYLGGGVVSAISTVIGWLVKIGSGVIEAGKKFVGAVKSIAEFVSGLKTKMGDALAFVKGIPGRIVSALGSLGRLLYNAGRDVIAGLVRGITDKLGAALDVVRNLAGRIADAAKSALGINSPSKVFRKIGLGVGEGFVQGIDRSVPSSEKAIRGLVGASVSAADGGLSGGVAAGGAAVRGAVVVNNYNPVAEPSSVTVSKTLTRLAFLGV